MADCARNALAVMREKGCRKMVWLGTDGVGSSRASAPWFFNWIGKLAATLFNGDETRSWLVWKPHCYQDDRA